ncbi:MFS family permease [Nocardia transvalensis]|uniref:MFS family permease n=1 Tax=Nocardia transvalensis TaxID=37333 RepID=A0A7W9P9F4_9NOCA|nr:MFS transporter [Nocardia transvalensis]MBB5911877.1 MFS family permease [Nocardia transvalensis]
MPSSQVWPDQVRRLRPRRALALLALALVSGLLGGDAVINAIAAPRAAEYFGMNSGTAVPATCTGAMTLVACVLGTGLLGDRFGRRRVLLGGVIVVAIGAVLTTYASGPLVFVLGRALTGAGLAASFGMTLAILPALFAAADLPRVFGVWLGVQSVAVMAASVIGIGLIDGTTWRTGYLTVGLLAVLFLVPAWLAVPDSKAAEPGAVGVLDLLPAAAAAAGLVGALSVVADRGWTDLWALAAMVGALGVVALVVRRELRNPRPGSPLRLFASRPFRAACLTGVLAGCAAAMVAVRALGAIQHERGLSASLAAVVVIPFYLGMVLGAVLAVTARERGVPVRPMYVSGLLCVGAGVVVLARMGVDTELSRYSLIFAVVGFGVMWVQNTQSAELMSAVPADSAGTAAAAKTIAGQLGLTLGLGLGLSAPVPAGGAGAAHPFTVGLGVTAALMFAGAAAVLVLLWQRTRAPRGTAESIDTARLLGRISGWRAVGASDM